MHGVIVTELQKYVIARGGVDTWTHVQNRAGLAGNVYLPVQSYPDNEVLALITAVTKVTHIDGEQVLLDFGKFLVPDLLRIYGVLVPADWTLFDVLVNLETRIHKVVRARDLAATPPHLGIVRNGPTSVVVRYASPRRLCALARGLIAGLAEHYGEQVAITETECMLRGDTNCRIGVVAVPQPRTPPAAAPDAASVKRWK